MWRFLRKRRALRAYRTKLFRQLSDSFGRKLYYSSEEVVAAVREIRASDEFVCYALGMYCDQAAFDAYHAASGEACDYGAMRHEIFAHVANVPASPDATFFDTGCGGHASHHDGGHHDSGHHDSGHHDSGHHDSGHHDGGFDFGGGGGHHGHH